jgi:hypothetical protein
LRRKKKKNFWAGVMIIKAEHSEVHHKHY